MSTELTRDQLSARLDTLENKAIRLDRYANLDSNSMPHLREMERERNAAKEVIMSHDAAQRATIQQLEAQVKELEQYKPTAGTESKYLAELRGVVALPDYMNCSMVDFARSLRVLIDEESRKPCGDSHLIAVLCNAARVGWELCHEVKKPLDSSPDSC